MQVKQEVVIARKGMTADDDSLLKEIQSQNVEVHHADT